MISSVLEFICEAHNGISAKIVEEAGFKGIWASGLTISASMGVRDSNEASWTQILEDLEFMSDITSIPILLDGDTGYGNFNNMRRLVQKLEQRKIAGVCIEDKVFPKTNSFIDSEKQPLAFPIPEQLFTDFLNYELSSLSSPFFYFLKICFFFCSDLGDLFFAF